MPNSRENGCFGRSRLHCSGPLRCSESGLAMFLGGLSRIVVAVAVAVGVAVAPVAAPVEVVVIVGGGRNDGVSGAGERRSRERGRCRSRKKQLIKTLLHQACS